MKSAEAVLLLQRCLPLVYKLDVIIEKNLPLSITPEDIALIKSYDLVCDFAREVDENGGFDLLYSWATQAGFTLTQLHTLDYAHYQWWLIADKGSKQENRLKPFLLTPLWSEK